MVASSALKLDTSMSSSIQSALSQVTQYECVPKQDGNNGRRRLTPWGQSVECSMVNVYTNMLQSQCLYMGTEMKQTATASEVCVSAGAPGEKNKMPECASRSLDEMITNMKECLNLNVTLLSSDELKVDLEPCFCAVVRFEDSSGRIKPVAVSVVDCFNSFSTESPMMRNLNAEAGNAVGVFGLEMNNGADNSAVCGLEKVVLWLYQYKNFPIRNDAPASPKENRCQEQAWLSNNADPLECSWKYLWELAIRSAQLES
eukprot:jgi/Picsp_1/5338/NSC_02699-R1_---NA---